MDGGGMKDALRKVIFRHPASKVAYERLRSTYHHVRKLAYYFSDFRNSWRFMRWDGDRLGDYWVLSSALLFQYHKLEKGFSMPSRRQVFGYDPAIATLDLVDKWRSMGFSESDPVFVGAVETLRTYSRIVYLPDEWKILKSRLDAVLMAFPVAVPELETPMRVRLAQSGVDESFRGLMLARRSVRAFADSPVSKEMVAQAVRTAQLAPSACNRQPWRVHAFSDKERIQSLLSLQNGNKGFGHVVPFLLIVTANSSGYFDASERLQPYVDAGLFSMSLILALQSVGLSSCCLNWCVDPHVDQLAHLQADIPADERIVMYIAVGYADSDVWVPRSARRAMENITRFH